MWITVDLRNFDQEFRISNQILKKKQNTKQTKKAINANQTTTAHHKSSQMSGQITMLDPTAQG